MTTQQQYMSLFVYTKKFFALKRTGNGYWQNIVGIPSPPGSHAKGVKEKGYDPDMQRTTERSRQLTSNPHQGVEEHHSETRSYDLTTAGKSIELPLFGPVRHR